jgi:SAM-dependent methyltransferase
MNDNSDEDAINSSLIGTKEYWDQSYERELNNYKSFGDYGEVWFGLKINKLIVDWINQNLNKESDAILDIGCGNGLVLIQLAKKKFKQLFGCDYSSNSIKLCEEITKNEFKSEEILINFEVIDILSDSFDTNSFMNRRKFDCIIDKGTYDAICLMPDIHLNSIRNKYKNSVLKLISKNGIFILISCNFTKEELFKHLTINDSFVLIHEFETPKISFGGKIGNQVTGLVLKKL